MKTIHTIFFLFWAVAISAQPIFRQPFYSYLGNSLDFSKISINGGLPYDGIGKKLYLEQLPENIGYSIVKTDLPTSNFVDAYSVLSPRLGSNAKGDVFFGTDRFGNLSGRLNNQFFKRKKIKINNSFHFQKRWERDKNENDLKDYLPGERFYWNPSASFHHRQLQLNAHFLYLNSDEWGGTTNNIEKIKEGQFGFSKKGTLSNFLLNGQQSFNNKKQQLKWNLNWTNTTQKRQLPNHFYEADEKIYDGSVQFQQSFDFSNLVTGIHFHDEKTNEYLNKNKIETADRFLKFFGGYNIFATDRLAIKPKINIEARKDDWSFLPAFQIDYGVIKEKLSASLYANTGKRINRPINYYLDNLALTDKSTIDFKKFETSQKIGLATVLNIDHQFKFKFKLNAHYANFDNKALLVKNELDNDFSFISSNKKLTRRTLEGAIQFNQNIVGNDLAYHFIYRWETFNNNDLIPFQNSHTFQFKIKYTLYDQLNATIHHIYKSPQNLNNYLNTTTPHYHRTDLHLDLYLKRLFNASSSDFISGFYVGLHFDNFINYFKNKKNIDETGLLLFPFQEEVLFDDPSLGNVRIEVGYKF